MSSNTKKINLVWDAWSDQGPMPNGLHPKYREEWDSHWKNQYGTNVLTRFIPYDRYSLGFFPVLLSQCNITYENITPNNVVLDDPEVENWYVMEPNHMDISLITENMFGNIDFKVIKLLREKKIKLVFYYAFEAFPFQQVDWLKTIQRSLGWLQIPSSQFVLIFGDLNLGENYKQFLNNHDQYYGYTFENLFVFDHFGWEFWDYLKTFVLTNPDQKELVPGTDETRDRKRPHRFLNLNGGARPHRKYLLTELKRQGLLDKGLYSYLNKFDIYYDPSLYCYKPIKKFDQDLSLVEMMAYHREHGNKIEEKHLDVDASEDAWHNRGMTAQHYQDTYFNIVSETWPADPSFFVTEKIFKPIVNLQPFVVCGLPGNLKYLKDKGFETFPEWFTEDYDNVQGHPQRMHYLTEQIVKVINWDDATIHRKYQDTWEKCLFNRKHFFAMNHAIEFTDLVNAIGDL
jgi:hypothetical protein